MLFMNSYLKEIADFCGIKKQLTMHIARYTFATTITLVNDVKLENVSKMLGHTSTRMTQHYAHVMNDSLAREKDRIAPLVDCVPKKGVDYYNYRRLMSPIIINYSSLQYQLMPENLLLLN